MRYIMKSFKLKAKHYKSLEQMLDYVGLVDKVNKEAYPSSCFVGPTTYKKLQKTLTKEYKKEYPNSTKKTMEYAIGVYMLNLAPVVVEGIEEDYILVEE